MTDNALMPDKLNVDRFSMSLILKSVIVLLFLSWQAHAVDNNDSIIMNLSKSTRDLSDIEKSKPPCETCQSDVMANDQYCPQVLQDAYLDMYRKGTVGTVNMAVNLVADGEDLRNPIAVCKLSAEDIKKIDIAKFNKELESEYPGATQLTSFTQRCSGKIGDKIENENIAKAYMAYDFNNKSNAITNTLTDLIESRAQINSMIVSDDKIECKKFRISRVTSRCEELNSCSGKNREDLFLIKSEEVSSALTTLAAINYESNKDISEQENETSAFLKSEYKKVIESCLPYVCSGTSPKEAKARDAYQVLAKEESEKLKLLKNLKKEKIELILDSNPLLRGDEFSGVIAEVTKDKKLSAPSEIALPVVQDVLKKQLVANQKNIQQKIKEYNGAYNCLVGKGYPCDKVEIDKLLSKTDYQNTNQLQSLKPNLSLVSSFYNCINTTAQSRDLASEKINGAISDAASLIPIVRVATTLAMAAKAASVLKKIDQAVQMQKKYKIFITANKLASGAYKTVDEYNVCTQVNKDFENLGAKRSAMSCGNIDQILVNKTNRSNCTNRAISQTLSTSSNAFKKEYVKQILKAPEYKEKVSKFQASRSGS